jgi:lipoprotein NlpD
MKKFGEVGLSSPRVLIAPVLMLLAACASDYQAPVDDRSSRLEREAPVIIVDGRAVPAAARAPVVTTSSSSDSATVVGAASTVVGTVTVGSGISRSTVTRVPAGPSVAEPAPVNQTPVNQTPAINQPAPTRPAQATGNISTQSAAPSVSGVSVQSGATHVVAQGDTLYSIAFAHNMDVRSLALANNLATPYTIYPGQRLSVSASGVSASAIDAVPQIPAAPAGEAAPDSGRRPQAAIDERRTGSVNTREVDGVIWQWPAEGRLLSTFSEASAARGIDIAGERGQAVYAAADGDVVYAGSGIQGAGNLVIVRHNERHLSAYMHNSAMLVGEGDRVRAGDKIAEIGSGPNGRDMLHFEVRVDGKPADPVRYLPMR